jgi:hypothetical protein
MDLSDLVSQICGMARFSIYNPMLLQVTCGAKRILADCKQHSMPTVKNNG